MVDNTDDPISDEYQQAGRREFQRVQTDHHTVKPGRYVNEGKVDPTHPGPKVGRRSKRRGR